MKKRRILSLLLASLLTVSVFTMGACTHSTEGEKESDTMKETTEHQTEGATEPETEKSDPTPEESGGRNILISVPIWRSAWANTESFKLLQDAGIDFAVAVSGRETGTLDTSRLMIAAAKSVWPEGKTGIRVMIHSTEFFNFTNQTKAQMAAVLNEFKNDPAVIGFHVIDEPYDANPYAYVERTLKGLYPAAIADINFLPGMAYGNYNEFQGRMDDYLKLVGMGNSSYLSLDNYPFPLTEGTVDEGSLFGNFETLRKVGMANGVPTAFYLLSVGSTTYQYRRPSEGVMRYHASAALAYGMKWIKYWSWYVPDYGEDYLQTYNDYTDAIMGKDGQPTEMYEVAKAMHAKIHAVGGILANLEATEVYHTGSTSTDKSYELLPTDRFLHPVGNPYAIVSLMTHTESGAPYLMIVNKDFERAQTLSFKLDGVDTVWTVSGEDGSYQKTELTDHVLTLTLTAGDFVLLRLPDGDYTKKAEPKENLLADALCTATKSDSGDGWYISRLFDGIFYSRSGSNGWRVSETGKQTLTFDLGEAKEFNRLTVYPAGMSAAVGADFPEGITLSISEDGQTWTEVFAETEIARPTVDVPSYSFAKQKARYVKVLFSATQVAGFDLAELKLFDDHGEYTAEKTMYKEPVVIAGENIALHKKPAASGSAYENGVDRWGLANVTDGYHGVTDGVGTNGWMSNGVPHVTDETWLQIDLGTTYDFDRVVVYPRTNGNYFPIGYQVQVSTDGKAWTNVATVTDDPGTTEGRVHDFDSVHARYVRILSTQLCNEFVGFANGYMMQIAEVEVYKK